MAEQGSGLAGKGADLQPGVPHLWLAVGIALGGTKGGRYKDVSAPAIFQQSQLMALSWKRVDLK